MPVFFYLLLALFSLLFILLIFWNIEARYYIESPSVKFLENPYVKVGLYPGDAEAVFLFSADDLNGETPKEDLEKILGLLDRHNVKGTFFAIPLFKGKDSPELAEHIKAVASRGHEIAQHGLTHTRSKYARIPYLRTFEFRGLTYEEQLERVRKGKKILESHNIKVSGFRTPNFSSNTDTLEILIKEGFSYVSDVRIRPEGKITNKRLLGAIYGSIYYPYFWETEDGRCLIIATNGDYTWDMGEAVGKRDLFIAKRRFNRYYENQGVFCLLTHLHPQALSRGRSLRFLDSFLKHASFEDVWMPTMAEFTRWWIGRCALDVEINEAEFLEVKLKLADGLVLKGLSIEIKEPMNYRVIYKGKVLKEGMGEETVQLDLS